MSRNKPMTLGEQAYNAYLNHLDPGKMNKNFPQWPHHLTEAQLRHWHTAVGPDLRSIKPHYKLVKIDDVRCGSRVIVPGLKEPTEVMVNKIIHPDHNDHLITLKCSGCIINRPRGTRLLVRTPLTFANV
ncbi:hypothetical protein fHeYen801_125 [Yersinia phage fHe-Yen8-01]|nr:hypothetical protein fHeYen801_125 [Yersinia phage fHe-Yen8-01]